MKKLLVFAIAILGFSAVSFGQATANASASATIVTPISISKQIDLNFGNVAVSAVTAGTVLLTPGGNRSATLGVTLPANTGTVSAASFTVSGVGNYGYSITLPSNSTPVTVSYLTNSMTVTNFTSTPSATGTLAAGGSQTLTVGATLNVAQGQVPGVYTTSGTGFPVTVNYN